ncbi:MAG: dihydrofolate reductase [Bacteroidales bacterium]|nr:dihydrofolate reductase [Bacteroidales bacterium]MDD4656830.1 dihydrofolate reductase [Bacteroidales bacterium]
MPNNRNTPTISIIVATSLNNAIGRNNQLLWHISEDLKYFKKITSGHTVIMGRKTWESIGRPLPNRRNIVISRSQNIFLEGAEVYSSLKDALKAANKSEGPCGSQKIDSEEVFIIGGGQIYKQALPIADKLYLTIVNETIEDADTFFPEIDLSQWQEIESESLDYGVRKLLISQ